MARPWWVQETGKLACGILTHKKKSCEEKKSVVMAKCKKKHTNLGMTIHTRENTRTGREIHERHLRKKYSLIIAV